MAHFAISNFEHRSYKTIEGKRFNALLINWKG